MLVNTHFQKFDRYNFWKSVYTVQMGIWKLSKINKINLIRTLPYRCFRICSTAFLLQSAVKDLKRLLLKNGYPHCIINFNINDVLNKNKNNPTEPIATVPTKDAIVLLPYTGFHSDHIVKRLKSCVNRFYSFVIRKVIFQNTRRIKNPSFHGRTVSTIKSRL